MNVKGFYRPRHPFPVLRLIIISKEKGLKIILNKENKSNRYKSKSKEGPSKGIKTGNMSKEESSLANRKRRRKNQG